MSRRSRDSEEPVNRDSRRRKRHRDRSKSNESDEDRRSRKKDKKDKHRKRDYSDERGHRSRKSRRRSYSRSRSTPSHEKVPRKKSKEREEGEADKYQSQRVEIENIKEMETEDIMNKIMGFSDFDTTKGKNHQHSCEEYVSKANRNKRQFRQYMNKKAATNRNDPMHT